MAWFTADSDAPTVEISKSETLEYAVLVSDNTRYVQTRTLTQWETRGLTNTAANTFVTAKATAEQNPVKTPIGGGGYNVRFSTDTVTGWVEDT